ncbi:MAG: hypothetical protein JW862_15240 [Anaerolineales bacterium]|nr:hypothetical protein [Anaerolineales bacterium]
MSTQSQDPVSARFSPQWRVIFGWLLCLLLLAGGLLAAFQALRDFNQAIVIVEWSTASELDTVGFNILRSENPTGPFQQINDSLIPASDNPYSGADYEYADTHTRRGQTYYYLLEDLEASGVTNQYGPIEIQASNNNPLLLLLAGILLASAALFGRQVWSDQRQLRDPNK